MAILVNRFLCDGNAICVREAPELFVLDDDEVVRVLEQPRDEEQLRKAQQAVRLCPKNALSLTDD